MSTQKILANTLNILKTQNSYTHRELNEENIKRIRPGLISSQLHRGTRMHLCIRRDGIVESISKTIFPLAIKHDAATN